jgi:transposase
MEKEKLTLEEAAKRFDVGSASISRWKLNSEPTNTRNRPAQKIDMDKLKKDVELNPDSFVYERAARFAMSESGIRYALKRLGISRKKSPKKP